jgi:Peptidase S46
VDNKILDKKLDSLYANTRLADTAERLRWFAATRKQIESADDALLKFAVQITPALLRMERQGKTWTGERYALVPRYMQAMIAFNQSQGRPIYPDANSTLRVTFGTVKGYAPRDSVKYAAQTSVSGIVEKATGIAPFDAPQAELAAIRAGDFGAYRSAALDNLPVDFLSDLDITGGNSGSPTLNARGELVGLAFDGAWEGVAGDWIFNPELSRTIHVDVRYMLWIMDMVDHADNLLGEMNIVK